MPIPPTICLDLHIYKGRLSKKIKDENNKRSESRHPEQDFPGSQAKPFEEDGNRKAANQGKTKCINACLLGDNPQEGGRRAGRGLRKCLVVSYCARKVHYAVCLFSSLLHPMQRADIQCVAYLL